jgi:GntR family transcriptional regulator/MocR family aminotransferase
LPTRTLYARSRAALLAALDEEFGERAVYRDSGAGLHIAVRLRGVPREVEASLVAGARERGVGIYPATICYATPPEELELVMGFTRLDEASIREGVQRLAETVDSVDSVDSLGSDAD